MQFMLYSPRKWSREPDTAQDCQDQQPFVRDGVDADAVDLVTPEVVRVERYLIPQSCGSGYRYFRQIRFNPSTQIQIQNDSTFCSIRICFGVIMTKSIFIILTAGRIGSGFS